MNMNKNKQCSSLSNESLKDILKISTSHIYIQIITNSLQGSDAMFHIGVCDQSVHKFLLSLKYYTMIMYA